MARSPSRYLSAAQFKVLRGVAAFERRGEPAFVMDLVGALGLKGESSISPTLQRIARNGFITLKGGGRGRSRIVHLTQRGRFEAAVGGLPLLGKIPAGRLEEAVAECNVVLDERDLLPFRPGDFALEVKGDSMVGDGIVDGDTVLLRPNVNANSGEIVAVIVGDDHEATLKRVYFKPGSRNVLLRASNPAYADQKVKSDAVRIAGVFRGLVRRPGHGRNR